MLTLGVLAFIGLLVWSGLRRPKEDNWQNGINYSPGDRTPGTNGSYNDRR